MKSSSSNLISAIVLAGAIALLALTISFNHSPIASGSTARGSEYQATTTVSTPGGFPAEAQLLTSGGTLGSVTITGAAAGTISFYDATTSSILLRAPNIATTSILLASFPLSAAAGTYTFDRVAFTGIYVVVNGTVPTSTITFRQ